MVMPLAVESLLVLWRQLQVLVEVEGERIVVVAEQLRMKCSVGLPAAGVEREHLHTALRRGCLHDVGDVQRPSAIGNRRRRNHEPMKSRYRFLRQFTAPITPK